MAYGLWQIRHIIVAVITMFGAEEESAQHASKSREISRRRRRRRAHPLALDLGKAGPDQTYPQSKAGQLAFSTTVQVANT